MTMVVMSRCQYKKCQLGGELEPIIEGNRTWHGLCIGMRVSDNGRQKERQTKNESLQAEQRDFSLP